MFGGLLTRKVIASVTSIPVSRRLFFSRLTGGVFIQKSGWQLSCGTLKASRRFSQHTVSDEFQIAQHAVKSLQRDPGNESKLVLHALFKQATMGDVNGEAPSMFDMVGKAKYDKWKSFKGLTQEEARVRLP